MMCVEDMQLGTAPCQEGFGDSYSHSRATRRDSWICMNMLRGQALVLKDRHWKFGDGEMHHLWMQQ